MSAARRIRRSQPRTPHQCNSATLAELRRDPRRLALLKRRGCELCGSDDLRHYAAWTPARSLQPRVMSPPGKVRTLIYALCGPCSQGPRAEVCRRVEDSILRGFDRMDGLPVLN